MKVVLFCGGYGMRMRDGTTDAPKPMITLGSRPLLWHVMRYYAHYGHKDFVLCLGYGAEHIKRYFLDYSEAMSNDFVLRGGGRDVELLNEDISDWTITFVDTGLESPIGERLRRVREHVKDEEIFLANYADVLTDAPLDEMEAQFRASDAVGTLVAVPPQSAFHVLDIDDTQKITDVHPVNRMPLWENGGYFMFRQGIFDHLFDGADLIEDGCGGLAKEGRMMAYRHRGFWHPVDTVKERAALDTAYQRGHRPWMRWERGSDPDGGEPTDAVTATLHDR